MVSNNNNDNSDNRSAENSNHSTKENANPSPKASKGGPGTREVHSAEVGGRREPGLVRVVMIPAIVM